jgi:predicted metal-binding membrane protein
MTNSVAQAVIKRDRKLVLAGLAAVIFAAAIFTVYTAGQFNKPVYVALMPTTHDGVVSVRDFLMLFITWAVMQVAMMSPFPTRPRCRA